MRLLLFFFLFSGTLQAQGSVHDFLLGGTARILDDECIQLTPDMPYVSGSAWYEDAIDLSKAFEMVICLVLGEKDAEGADGIVFVFHPAMRTGYRGEGMGFAGLVPSLGIEFDTYQNFHLGDPEADHLAIMPNGRAHHALSMLGPIGLPNLEDGARHSLRIIWDPAITQLEIYLDGELRGYTQVDIVKDIFGGNPLVFWGATAATGRLSNLQAICIKKLVYAAVE
ncbi:MAG: L-type lectin-domain containing protein [Bacteroidota bacterium]